MANLPPRPESPRRDIVEHRFHERPAAYPMTSRDRSYLPPPRRHDDTYVPSSFDRRRHDDRRPDYSQPYERPNARDSYSGRERERDIRGWERTYRDRDDRPQLDRSPRRDGYDRSFDRRRYESIREQPNIRRHSRFSSPHRFDPVRRPSRSPPRRPSRSPSRRSPLPPTHRRAPSFSDTPTSSFRAPKRIKLGNHSISTSPRSPNHLQSRSPTPREFNRSLRNEEALHPKVEIDIPLPRAPTSTNTSQNESAMTTLPVDNQPHQPHVDEEQAKAPSPPTTLPAVSVSPTTNVAHIGSITRSDSPSRLKVENNVNITVTSAPKPHQTENYKINSDNVGRLDDNGAVGSIKTELHEISLSPPKQPSAMTAGVGVTVPPTRSQPHRSPPRGPRNHQWNPPTNTATSYYPAGPRGRRPYLAHEIIPNPTPLGAPVDDKKMVTPNPEAEVKYPLPAIPIMTKREFTSPFDQELNRLEAHRTHLTTEYIQTSKIVRRALLELELCTIELNAAEGRRKIADAQLEKAKNGILGMDAPPEMLSQII